MEIIQESSIEDVVSCDRVFLWREDPSAGFFFPCDENGDVGEQNPAAAENYRKCKDGTYDVVDKGIEKTTSTQRVPAIGKCVCGREVVLVEYGMSGIDCDCGRIYNSSGQELAQRSQWGEETGESYADITRPGDPFDDF